MFLSEIPMKRNSRKLSSSPTSKGWRQLLWPSGEKDPLLNSKHSFLSEDEWISKDSEAVQIVNHVRGVLVTVLVGIVLYSLMISRSTHLSVLKKVWISTDKWKGTDSESRKGGNGTRTDTGTPVYS